MRIVFFGTAGFAVPALEALASHVALVVSQPDRPSGRGMKLKASPVKVRAVELGLEVSTPEKCRAPEFVERIRSLEADALLVAAYGQILSQPLLDAAKRGGINLHGSVLPKYRGAAPIQRAILAGEVETGVTLMQMDRGMDTGDVIAIQTCPIGGDETYGELEAKLGQLAAEMATEWLPRVVMGEYPRTPQDSDAATYAPKVGRAEAELIPLRPASTEYNRFRAFTPSPGAFMNTRVGRIKLLAMRPSSLEKGAPGTIIESRTSLVIAFEDGSLELLQVQPEGKKGMSGREFANGMRFEAGTSIL